MRYEVIEVAGEWIVRSEGVELARFAAQSTALDYVATRLRAVGANPGPVSLRVSYGTAGAQTRISK